MYMDEMNPAPQPPRIPRVGLAMASLILGILAVCLSFLLVGVLLGLVGLLLGGIHLAGERHYRGMAAGGVALSVAGAFLSVVFGIFYTVLYQEMMPVFSMDFMDETNLAGWEGVLAPDMTLPALDGQEYTLSELRGRRVVIDLWATWCGPCRDEIPHFIQLASEHPADELIIIGVSKEDPDTLLPFMEKMGVNYPIVSQTGLPSPYDDVVSIPTTFFIDRNGVIQNVLSGYQDYETLRAAAVSEDYEGTPLDAPPVPRDGLLDSPVTLAPEERWTHELPASVITTGDWDGDGIDEILATNWGESLTVLDAEGAVIVEVSLPESVDNVALIAHSDGPRLLGYSILGDSFSVMGLDGTVLWEYKSGWLPSYLEDVHWGDVDGDGNDEFVASMMNGLHLVSEDGTRLWRSRQAGAGSVAIVPDGSGAVRIISAEFMGFKVLDTDGEEVLSFGLSGEYIDAMRAVQTGVDGPIQILVDCDEQVMAVGPSGTVQWTAPMLGDDDFLADFCAWGDLDGDGQGEWVFLEPNGDLAVATPDGARLGLVPGKTSINSVTITRGGRGPGILVVLEANVLTAYSFRPGPAPAPETPETPAESAEPVEPVEPTGDNDEGAVL